MHDIHTCPLEKRIWRAYIHACCRVCHARRLTVPCAAKGPTLACHSIIHPVRMEGRSEGTHARTNAHLGHRRRSGRKPRIGRRRTVSAVLTRARRAGADRLSGLGLSSLAWVTDVCVASLRDTRVEDSLTPRKEDLFLGSGARACCGPWGERRARSRQLRRGSCRLGRQKS